MKILITGADGFIGHNLVDYFISRNYSVLFPAMDELDLTDSVAVEKYFNINSIDTIVHCATTLRDGTSYPKGTCENNLRMFFNLQKQLTSSMRMINLGSGSEYDRKYWHKKMEEGFFDKHIPEDDHSYAKYLISKYISDTKNENIVCLRIFGVFGKYEDYRYKFISNTIVKNLFKMPIVINQNVVYDYIYINDFARIVEYFVINNTKNKIFNVTTTESIDLLTIANMINNVSDYISEIHILNDGIGVEYTGDNNKLLSEIGDFKFTPQDEAITELRKYYFDIRETLDREAVQQDAYLDYAKNLHTNYFSRKTK